MRDYTEASRIIEAALKGYDLDNPWGEEEVTYEQACRHDSGDTLRDFIICELTEGLEGYEDCGFSAVQDRAIQLIGTAIAELQAALSSVHDLKKE